jgi:hypothetical protein
MEMVVLGAWRPADPSASYFPVAARPVVMDALNAENFVVLDEPGDDVLFDALTRWCGRVAVVTPVAQILCSSESVRAPGGAASDGPAAVTAEVPESPAFLEVFADLEQVR